MQTAGQPKDTRGWIETLAGQDTTEIRQQALASLIERGILESQDKKFLWVFRARRYPTIDGRVEREVRLRISDVLLSDDIPDPRDVAMICLVDACRIPARHLHRPGDSNGPPPVSSSCARWT